MVASEGLTMLALLPVSMIALVAVNWAFTLFTFTSLKGIAQYLQKPGSRFDQDPFCGL